jgi:hypothetical protein
MQGDQEKVNEIIECLVKNFDQYMKNVNDRLKINSLFNEFEDKARNDLMSLVKLSNSRYKSVKSGNTLQNVIHKQIPIYHHIVFSALGEKFYQTNEIFLEKKKFNTMNNKDKNNQIHNLRVNIKENTKNLEENGGNLYERGGEKYSQANMRFFEKLSKVKSPTMEEINYNIKREKINRLDYKTKLITSPIGGNKSDRGNIKEPDTDDKSTETKKLCKFKFY